MNKLFSMFIMNIGTVLEIYDLAKKNGKKVGDDCTEEFKEIYNRDPSKFIFLGTTDKDKDLILGNLREEGFRINTIEELQKENEKRKTSD